MICLGGLIQMNQERKRSHYTLVIGVIVGILFSALTQSFFGIIIVMIPTVVIAMVFYNRYSQMFKTEVVAEVVSEFFENASYHPKKGISMQEVKDTNLIATGNRYTSEDMIVGNYKNKRLEISDVLIQNVVHTGKTTTTVTYFNGLIVKTSALKTGVRHLYVIDDNMHYSSPKGLIFNPKNLEKVILENPKFHAEFRVFSQDAQDAFYILTPHVMERFLRIHQRDVSIYIQDQTMYLAISTKKDHFEPHFFKVNDVSAMKETIRQDIRYILEILDILNLS